MDSSDSHPLTPDDIAEALRLARERDLAPPRLHARIAAMQRERAQRPAWRGRGVWAGGFATAVAAIVAVVILVAPGGTPGAPTLAQAVALASRPAAPNSGPTVQPAHPYLVNASVGEIYFPSWTSLPNGWHAVGERVDHINGRRAVTVFYQNVAGQQVAYTILGAPALAWPKAQHVLVGPVPFYTLLLHGRRVTTWRRGNNTCILSGIDVRQSVLLKLASASQR